jgi:hypothetical protein
MYTGRFTSYFLIVGFLSVNIANAGWIIKTNEEVEDYDTEGNTIFVKKRDIDIYFGKGKIPQNNNAGEIRKKFNLENLNDELKDFMFLTEKGRCLGTISFYRVNKGEDVEAMKKALNHVFWSLDSDITLSSGGTLNQDAEEVIKDITLSIQNREDDENERAQALEEEKEDFGESNGYEYVEMMENQGYFNSY